MGFTRAPALVRFALGPVVALALAGSVEFAAAQAPANPLAVHTLESLEVTRQRPLFSPTRRGARPPAFATKLASPPVVRAPIVTEPEPELTVIGIVANGGDVRAIVRVGRSDLPLRVRVGDKIGSWGVAQIAPRHLVLILGDRSVTFTLFSRGKMQVAAPAAPAVRQAGVGGVQPVGPPKDARAAKDEKKK